MPVIAVINRKGGSGKSTLATHVAAYCATRGWPVMLADADRQQSVQAWLRRREERHRARHAPILGGIVDARSGLRVPAGVRHAVLDTAGGLRGFELARVVMAADAILMPVCNSVFDRESSADCYAELKALPRVASGQCRVAAVGMRIDARTKGIETLRTWAAELGLPFVGTLRETQGYVHCIERGLTLFDLDLKAGAADLLQWQPIIAWLEPLLSKPETRTAQPAQLSTVQAPQPSPPLRPTYRLVPPTFPARPSTTVAAPASQGPVPSATRLGRLLDVLPIPRFLQRTN